MNPESSDIVEEMLVTPIHQLSPRDWTKDTARDLRRLLNRIIEQHVERNLQTPRALEAL